MPQSVPSHVPVLVERVVALLAPALVAGPAVLVDATVGLGGHAAALLERHPELRLVGLDRDPAALAVSADRLAAYAARVHLVATRYDELAPVLRRLGLDGVDGVLFDLGVSSMQLDDPSRGFTYARDAPLDMRMDPATNQTAADVLNTYPVGELARILRGYGEERFSRRIAEAVARERSRRPWASTAELAEVVRAAIPAATRRTGGHPAKRTFQALRIEVNGELAALEAALPAAVAALRVGGRIVAISYHSLEDRLVKRVLAERAVSTSPADLPVELPGHDPELRLLTRGAEVPSADEVRANPRSASARLRAAERLREAA